MKRIPIFKLNLTALLSALLVSCGGGGDGGATTATDTAPIEQAADTHEAAMGDMIGLMDKFASTLEGAKDAETATAAAKTLAELEPKFESLGKRMESLGEPPAELEPALKEKFEGQMEPLMERMMKASLGMMANPEVAKILEPAINSLQSKMGAMGPGGAAPAAPPVPAVPAN